MKNIAKNTFTYTGIVTLSQYIGAKKVKIAQVHNTGGASLFDFLSDCLIGKIEEAQIKKPVRVRLVTKSSGDGTCEWADNSGFIYKRDDPKKQLSPLQSAVTYSFLIPREFFSNMTTFSNLYLGLYAESETDASKYAALCSLAELDKEMRDATLLVDWKLVISNPIK